MEYRQARVKTKYDQALNAQSLGLIDAFQILYAVIELRRLLLFKNSVGAMLEHRSCRHDRHCGDGGVTNRRRERLVFLFSCMFDYRHKVGILLNICIYIYIYIL